MPLGIDEPVHQYGWGQGFQLGQGEGDPYVWAPQSIQYPQALAHV